MSLLEWIQSVLGSYTPVTYQVYAGLDSEGVEIYDEIVAAGTAGVDWQYILTALFLIVTVYSVFRLIGVLLEGVRR